MRPLVLWLTLAAALAAPASAGDALDRKLALQWERYELARGFLARGVSDDRGRINRDQWEWLLALPGARAFTEEDLATLRDRQREAIEASRARARRESRLDLDAVRAAGEVEAFCRDLPKGAMLHVHPGGTLDPDTVKELLDAVNPVIERRALLERVVDAPMDVAEEMVRFLEPYGPAVHYADLSAEDQALARALFFWPPGTKVPQIAFGMTSLIRDEPKFDEILLGAFFERARAHHVLYVEMTKHLKARRGTYRALDQIEKIARNHGVTARFVVGLNRANKEPKNLEKVTDWIESKGHEMVVGVDLYGREVSVSTLDAGQRLYARVRSAREQGRTRLHTTTHAAGLGEPRNPRDALVMGVERIGHGIRLRDDPVALAYARLKKTPIETNLTSNVRLGYVESLESHPYLDFLRLGLRVSLSTDDEGMLETDISQECALAVGSFDLQYAELEAMVRNSVETSFADGRTRARLAARVEADLAAFEERWSRFRRELRTGSR
jgi:adenosine deaminase